MSESRSQAGQRRKPQRPYEGASQRSDDLTLPEPDFKLNAAEHWNLTQRPF